MVHRASHSTTQEKVDGYESFYEVFSHLYKELKALGSKKPTETLSESKVKIVNRLLIDISHTLDGEPEHKYLDLLDDEALPQYSDAILIISQYEGALKGFHSRNYGYDRNRGVSRWSIEGED